ncbi:MULTISPECIES: hypothetical protein [unclassified Leifsonia]|nr:MULTISPECIES: hypothetical protein [unclassified Leifsonia]SEH83925.1 hypothetical protein SAMN04515694_10528 [Leifsonia sp. CL154]SFL46530.1 hypothetical protein SAMN04515692_10527 [Leifsonia sp. CL147]
MTLHQQLADPGTWVVIACAAVLIAVNLWLLVRDVRRYGRGNNR